MIQTLTYVVVCIVPADIVVLGPESEEVSGFKVCFNLVYMLLQLCKVP